MTKVCTMCETTTINESESICQECKEKYGISPSDNSKDGCGCDS